MDNCRNFSIETEYKKEIEDIYREHEDRKKRKQALIGTVVSTKCAKSITIRVTHKKYNQKYNVFTSEHRKFMAHDEGEEAEEGDLVRIVPCRPMSRMKRHALIDIMRKAKKIEATDDDRKN
jgi:small subunit ribosomal protein S17